MDGSGVMTPGALVGQVVADKYRIDSIIGEGGMGYVVSAHHMQLETKVAIKLLRPELAASGEAVELLVAQDREAVQVLGALLMRDGGDAGQQARDVRFEGNGDAVSKAT